MTRRRWVWRWEEGLSKIKTWVLGMAFSVLEGQRQKDHKFKIKLGLNSKILS
jgi:hypothetical protein